MRKLDITDIRHMSLDVLSEVDSFCREHHIRYSLFSGTLLGCIRHQGFIPWDDDIDIAMPRHDYDLFVNTFVSDRCEVITCFTNRQYYLPWAKVFLKGTQKKEKVRGVPNPIFGVDIDVYPCDYIESPCDAKRIKKRIEKYRRIRGASLRPFVRGTPIKNFVSILFSGKANLCSRKIDLLGQSFNAYEHNFIFRNCIFSMASEVYDVDIFDQFEMRPFEDRAFLVSRKYDHILKVRYGNYLEPPPEKERFPHHGFEAYLLD